MAHEEESDSCIAAVCDHSGSKEAKIVMCADLQGQSEGVGASEAEDKLGFVRKGWPALIAGTITRADELLDVYAEYLRKNFAEHLRKPAHTQKENLIDEYLRQTYAFDRQYFLWRGVEKFSDAFVAQVTSGIKKIKLDVSLIAGFLKETYLPDGSSEYSPFLSLVDEEQSSLGTSTALSSLSPPTTAVAQLPRGDAIQRLRANRLSEQVPGMGKNFLAMYVALPVRRRARDNRGRISAPPQTICMV